MALMWISASRSVRKLPNFSSRTAQTTRCCSSKESPQSSEGPATNAAQTLDDDEIERIRNKSRLPAYIREEMQGKAPAEIHFDYQITKTYKRKMYGRFGRASGVNPSLLWPTRNEIKEIMELEAEFEPTFQERLESARQKTLQMQEAEKQRLKNVEANLAKLDGWMNELQRRKDRKLAELNVARERRERLVEEVREYFGYPLSPKDPKFQEVLAKKEEEDKKAQKKAKKEEKLAREMAKLANMAKASMALKEESAEDNSKKTPTKDKSERKPTENESGEKH